LGARLPTEFEGTIQYAIFGLQIVDRVNFDRGRVRPSLAFDAWVGADLIKNDHLAVCLKADIQNFNNRLNLVNFACLFSGTGVAAPQLCPSLRDGILARVTVPRQRSGPAKSESWPAILVRCSSC
jgi:hypothetical protein